MSRRIKPRSEYALAQRVEQLWSRFEYPDFDTPAPGIGGVGGGGAPTVVVAASDASDLSKSKADFVCTGVNDQDVIQAAVQQVPAAGGRALLTEGSYFVDTNTIDLGAVSNAEVWLQGLGVGTRLSCSNATGTIITPGPDCVISDMLVVGASTDDGIAGSGSDDRVRIRNVRFQGCDTAVHITGDRWHVTDCYVVSGVLRFVEADNGLAEHVIANNRTFSAAIDMGESRDWLVANNQIGGAVLFNENGASTGVGVSIVGNHFFNASAFNNGIIEGTSSGASTPARINIVGNQFDLSFEYCIWLEDCRDFLIASNVISGAFGAVTLTDCADGMIADNTIFGDSNDDTPGGAIRLITTDDTYIHGNRIRPDSGSPATYGINIASGDCNIVVGNDIGDDADYGTANYNDSGTNTQNTYPNDPTIGDNFGTCPPSSPSSP